MQKYILLIHLSKNNDVITNTTTNICLVYMYRSDSWNIIV